MSISIVWFRTDLRVEDNLSLSKAAENSAVIPLFVWDPERPTYNASNRLAFLIESIEDLAKQIEVCGSQLILRVGKPEEVLVDLVKETGASSVYFGRHYEPYEIARDVRVVEALEKILVSVVTQKENVLFESNEIQTQAGKPFTVFTPFKKKALVKLTSALPYHRTNREFTSYSRLSDLRSDSLPISLRELETSPKRQPGGSERANFLWNNFSNHSLIGYKQRRDHLGDEEGTSRLSPHLKFGTISIRAIVRELIEIIASEDDRKEGAETFLSELLWREFYSTILQSFPQVVHGAFQERFNKLEWQGSEEHFERWKEGKTGFPIVDAAMRQLQETGWMHNRARMIVASFLVKDLLIDWRKGERHFMEMLTDGDLAQNNGGWQWSASTGTDAQPYYRIFNPYLQSKKFDPKGIYIKRYLPGLSTLPAELIHAPHLLSEMEQHSYSVVLGVDYPKPVVDHSEQRMKAIAMFKAV